LVQVAAAFGYVSGQTVAQSPQWLTSVFVLVSHPLRLTFSSASQLANPASHAMLHAPAAQVGAPFALLQAWPQAPQWLSVVSTSVSQPTPLVQSP
jgi:hypothetical protein